MGSALYRLFAARPPENYRHAHARTLFDSLLDVGGRVEVTEHDVIVTPELPCQARYFGLSTTFRSRLGLPTPWAPHTRAKDDDSIALFSYDSLGRVLTEKQGDNPFGTSAKTVSYSYAYVYVKNNPAIGVDPTGTLFGLGYVPGIDDAADAISDAAEAVGEAAAAAVEAAAGAVVDAGEFMWTLPTNLVGGGLKLLSGDALGGTKTRDCWFVLPRRGLTIGDFEFYADAAPGASIQSHEGAHVTQSDMLGPLYLPASALSWGVTLCTFGYVSPATEVWADDIAGTNFY